MNIPIEIVANILKFNENKHLICKELLKYYNNTIRYENIDFFSIFFEKANIVFKSYIHILSFLLLLFIGKEYIYIILASHCSFYICI